MTRTDEMTSLQGGAEPSSEGGVPADPAPRDAGEPIFCEGCGARLLASDRTCPKCGRPAPGILSTRSASSDLAAGRTASFPRLTPGMIAEAAPATAPRILAESLDPEATNVLDASKLEAAAPSLGGAAREAGRARARAASAAADDYRRPRRGRWVALALGAALLVGGAWFVTQDPWGVMPGFYASFDEAASEMFPSRYGDADVEPAAPSGDGAKGEGSAAKSEEVSDKALSDEQAYVTLSGIYERIGGFREDFGTVIDDYSAWFIASSLSTREDGSRSAYDMRDAIQKTIDQIDGLKLADGSPYAEDVDHMRQLAQWMYNRVDVICRCWDISLSYPDGADVASHSSEIAQPLVEAGDVGAGNEDTDNLDAHYAQWEPERR